MHRFLGKNGVALSLLLILLKHVSLHVHKFWCIKYWIIFQNIMTLNGYVGLKLFTYLVSVSLYIFFVYIILRGHFNVV